MLCDPHVGLGPSQNHHRQYCHTESEADVVKKASLQPSAQFSWSLPPHGCMATYFQHSGQMVCPRRSEYNPELESHQTSNAVLAYRGPCIADGSGFSIAVQVRHWFVHGD